MRVGEGSTVGKGCNVLVGLAEATVAPVIVVGNGVDPADVTTGVGVGVDGTGVVPGVVGMGVVIVVPPKVEALSGPSNE